MLADLYRYRRYTTLRVADSFLVRIHPFLQTLTFIIPVVAQIVFWKAVYAGGPDTMGTDTIGGYNVSDTILYLIVIQAVGDLTWAYSGHIQSEIRFGELTDFLLKPGSYSMLKYFEHIGNMITRWMNVIILMVVVVVFFSGDIDLKAELWAYPAGLVSVALTFHLQHVFRLCVAYTSFWMEGHPPLLGHLSKLFGGRLVPLTFLPSAFQGLSEVLPFRYMLYFPTSVLLGKVTPEAFVFGAMMQLVWIVVFGLISKLMWREGVKRYVAYGG